MANTEESKRKHLADAAAQKAALNSPQYNQDILNLG